MASESLSRAVYILIFPLLVADCFGLPGGSNSPPADPVCGFTARHFYLNAASVKRGLAVDLLVGDVLENQLTSLRFFVHQKPRNSAVDDLQVEHEKLIHVFGVREDLTGFFHLHPSKVDEGLWSVDHVFEQGGTYRLWSDVKYRGVSYSFAHPKLTVPSAGSEAKEPGSSERKGQPNYRIVFRHPEVLLAGETNRLEFTINDQSGAVVPTENFLGAAMHLVMIKEDCSVFLHGHPVNHGSVATNVIFSQIFPESGRYKFFLQYRPSGMGLPSDAALLEEFYGDVVNSK
jgi:hypothetical protein